MAWRVRDRETNEWLPIQAGTLRDARAQAERDFRFFLPGKRLEIIEFGGFSGNVRRTGRRVWMDAEESWVDGGSSRMHNFTAGPVSSSLLPSSTTGFSIPELPGQPGIPGPGIPELPGTPGGPSLPEPELPPGELPPQNPPGGGGGGEVLPPSPPTPGGGGGGGGGGGYGPVSPDPPNNDPQPSPNETIDEATSDLAWWDIGEEGFGLAEGGILAGTLAALGLGGVLIRDTALPEDERVFLRRYNATADDADAAWFTWSPQFSSALTDSQMNNLRDVLKRDFARGGPLSRAYTQGKLAANRSRDNWSAFDKDYNTTNFKPGTVEGQGVVVTVTEPEEFWFEETNKEVLSQEEIERLISSGRWSQRGNKFVNNLGQTLNPRKVRKNESIPEIDGLTPIQWLGGARTADDAAVASEASAAAEEDEATRKRMATESRIRDLEASLARVGSRSAAEVIAQREATRKQQEAADARALLAQQKREADLAKMEKDKQQRILDARMRGYAKLGQEMPDSETTWGRHQLEKGWIETWINARFGDSIESWKYVRTGKTKDANGNPTGPDELVLVYSDESAPNFGHTSGMGPEQRTEKWKRSELIGWDFLPVGFGPGGVPIWKSGRDPAWFAQTDVVQKTGVTAFTRRMPRTIADFNRRMNGSGYRMEKRTRQRNIRNRKKPEAVTAYVERGVLKSKNDARLLAKVMRHNNIRTRVHPVKGGHGLYLNDIDVKRRIIRG